MLLVLPSVFSLMSVSLSFYHLCADFFIITHTSFTLQTVSSILQNCIWKIVHRKDMKSVHLSHRNTLNNSLFCLSCLLQSDYRHLKTGRGTAYPSVASMKKTALSLRSTPLLYMLIASL